MEVSNKLDGARRDKNANSKFSHRPRPSNIGRLQGMQHTNDEASNKFLNRCARPLELVTVRTRRHSSCPQRANHNLQHTAGASTWRHVTRRIIKQTQSKAARFPSC
ncbi:hypothetical protein TRVL_08718 [Trypanosoma vivax]|nr:hypothetical protein TRVL_08718 [Trypanosoma vivax]